MMNLMGKTASKALRKAVGAKSSTTKLKCKLTLVIKRIVLGAEQGSISVELSRGLKAAATDPMPVRDGIVVLASGSQELSIISTIERTAENVRCEKIFKLSVKLLPADQRGRKNEAESRVLGAIEIDVADFVGNGDPANVEQARTWSIPCRKGEKHITIETVCSARPVSTHKVPDDSEESSDIADISDGSDDTNMLNLEQVFTGSDLMISALKFQSDSDYNSESDASPAKAISPPMLGIGGGFTSGVQRQITAGIRRKLSKPGGARNKHAPRAETPDSDGLQPIATGGVSDSPLNPVSLTVSKIQSTTAERASDHASTEAASSGALVKGASAGLAKANKSTSRLNVITAGNADVLAAHSCPLAVCSSMPGSASREGEKTSSELKGNAKTVTDEDWSMSMGEITSPKSAAAKEELFQTLKASLKVRESQVLELQSESARLQARLGQAERESDEARKALEKRSQNEARADLPSAGGQTSSDSEICARCEVRSAEVHRHKTQLVEVLEQARVQSLTIQNRDRTIGDLEAKATATAADIARKKHQLHAQLEQKEREVEQLTSKFGIADREMVLLESELKESERKNERLHKEVNDLQVRCNALKQNVAEEVKRAELDANARQQDFERKSEEQQDRTRSLKDKVKELQAEVSAKSIQLSEREAQVKEMKEEGDRLRSEIEDMKKIDAEVKEAATHRDNALQEARRRSELTESRLSSVEESHKKVDTELGELKMRLEASERSRHETDSQIGVLQGELEAEKTRNENLQQRMAAEEHKANKMKAELKAQIEEMDGLLANERILSQAKGQEHEEGQSKLEDLNQVLSQRVERLTVEQTAASENNLMLTAQCQELHENVQSLQADSKRMNATVQSLEASKKEMQALVHQLQLELQEVAKDRDAHALRVKAQETEIRQYMSDVSNLQAEIAKDEEEKKVLEQMIQALEIEHDDSIANVKNEMLVLQKEARQQQEKERQVLGEELVGLREQCQQYKALTEVILQELKDAQVLLSPLLIDVESLVLLKEQGDEQYAALNRDLAHTKDTIAQLKELCSRTEADLMKKQEALHVTQDELGAVLQTNDELVEALARLRTENTTLHEAQERLREVERTWEMERGEWLEQKTAWERERALEAEEKAQALAISLAEEEERKRQGDEVRLRLQREIEEAKSLGGAGWPSTGGAQRDISKISCPCCAILQAQENMLLKGLSAECALLDMLQQRFPLLVERENQRLTKAVNQDRQRSQAHVHASAATSFASQAPGPSHKRRISASSWLKDQKDMGRSTQVAADEAISSTGHAASTTSDATAGHSYSSGASPASLSACGALGSVEVGTGRSTEDCTDAGCASLQAPGGDRGDRGGSVGTDTDDIAVGKPVTEDPADDAVRGAECYARIQALESELRQVRADADLDASVASASQRQLVAASERMAKLEEQVEQLQSENLDKAPMEEEAEMIQQLINARVAHAVNENNRESA